MTIQEELCQVVALAQAAVLSMEALSRVENNNPTWELCRMIVARLDQVGHRISE